MTSWLRGTRPHLPTKRSAPFLQPPQLTAAPPVRGSGSRRGGAIDTILPPQFGFFSGRFRSDVVVEGACFGFPDVLIEDDADDDVLKAAGPAADADAIALAQVAIWFGVAAVDVHLPALAGALGFRTRLEEAGDIEPDVQADGALAQTRISTFPLARSDFTNASVSLSLFWFWRYCSSCGRTSSSGTVRPACFSATLMMW